MWKTEKNMENKISQLVTDKEVIIKEMEGLFMGKKKIKTENNNKIISLGIKII